MSFRSSEKEYLAQHPIESKKSEYIIPIRNDDIPEINKLHSDNKLLLVYTFSSFFKGDNISKVFGLLVDDKLTYYRFRVIPEFQGDNVYLNIALDTLARVVEISGAYIRDTNVWKDTVLLSDLFPTIEDYKKAFFIGPNYVRANYTNPVGKMYLNLNNFTVYIDGLEAKTINVKEYHKFNSKLTSELTTVKGKYKNSNDKYETVKLTIPVFTIV